MPTTRSKSTSRKGKSRWSPEQIEEWRRRDDAIMDSSTGYLEDADSVRQFAREAAAGRVSARILGYSLRNQILLEKQAAEFGFTLTDVASAKEWRERGRRIKPEWKGRNLRLVAPKTKQKKDADPGADETERDDVDDTDADDEADDEQAADEAGDQDAKKAQRRKFKTVAVFDLAQTEAIRVEESKECALCLAEAGEPCNPGCTCGACVDYEPTDDAADVVWNNLVEQIGKAGYAYDWPATAANLNGARVSVDHDARTVYAAMRATADAPEAVADLAAVLAEIIARADRAAETRRAERRTARAALTAI